MEVYCIVNQTVKLSTPTRKTQLQTPLAYNNTLAHCMRVTVVNEDGTDADLTGVGVTASMMLANGQTVEPINGTASGNVAEVILPASCYLVPGRFKFTMNLTSGGTTRTILWVEGYIERNTTTQIIDPGTPVPNITQAIGNANAAASAASAAATTATTAAQTATSISKYIAPEYDPEGWYTYGNVVSNQGKVYRCTAQEYITGEFNPAKWAETDAYTSTLDMANQYVKDRFDSVAARFDPMLSYSVGDYVFYGTDLYRYIAAHTGGQPFSTSETERVTVSEELKAIKAATQTATASETLAYLGITTT